MAVSNTARLYGRANGRGNVMNDINPIQDPLHSSFRHSRKCKYAVKVPLVAPQLVELTSVEGECPSDTGSWVVSLEYLKTSS